MATVDEILLAAENNEEDADGCELRLEDILNEDESQFDLFPSPHSAPTIVKSSVSSTDLILIPYPTLDPGL